MIKTIINMDLQARKLQLMEECALLDDAGIIGKLVALLRKEKRKLYKTNLRPMSMQELQERIDRSEEDIKTGRVYNQSAIESYFKNRTKK